MSDEPKTNLFGKPTAPTESKPPVEVAAAPSSEPVNKESDFEVRYASSQIARLRIGRFQFEHGVLVLKTKEDAELFAKLLEDATTRTKQSVQKIDKEAGEKIAEKFLASSRGQMIRGGDTTGNIVSAPTPGDQKHVA